MEEIEDEFEHEMKMRIQLNNREKLKRLFCKQEIGKSLQQNEYRAIVDFLEKYVGAFKPSRMTRRILEELVYRSLVLEIDSDSLPYQHNDEKYNIEGLKHHNKLQEEFEIQMQEQFAHQSVATSTIYNDKVRSTTQEVPYTRKGTNKSNLFEGDNEEMDDEKNELEGIKV